MKSLKELFHFRSVVWLALAVTVCFSNSVLYPIDTNENNPSLFNKAEKQFIKNHPVITIALDDANPPLNFRDSRGVYSGISVDYMKMIARKSGLDIRFWGAPWNKALSKAMGHEVDGIMSASLKDDRLPYLNFTEPYFEIPLALITMRNFPKVEALRDFNGKRIAVVRETVRIPIIKKYSPYSEVVEVDSPLEGAKMILEGKADAFFDDLPVVQDVIDKGFLSSLKIALIYIYPEAGAVRVGLRKDYPLLLSVFNKSIAAITAEEHRSIKAKWLLHDEGISEQRELALTDDELAWLEEHPVIRVGVDPGWAPIEWRRANGEYSGIAIEYLRKMQFLLGIKFEYVPGSSWQELLSMRKTGGLDMYSAIAETPEKKTFLNFSKPYFSTPIVIFSKIDRQIYRDMKQLRGRKIAVVEGYYAEERLREESVGSHLLLVRSMQEGFNKLRNGEVDVYLEGLLPGTYFLTKTGDTTIRVTGESSLQYNIGFGYRKDWPKLHQIMDKAFNAINQDERELIQRQWLSFNSREGMDYRVALALGAGALLGLFFILRLGILIRQRTIELKQEEERRRQKEKDLQESEKRYRLLAENIRDVIWVMDLDGRFTFISPSVKELRGYTVEEAMKLSIKETLAPESFELAMSSLQEILSGNFSIAERNWELEQYCKGGGTVWTEVRANVLRDEDGKITSIMGVSRDISERRKAELALQSSLKEKETLLREIHHRVKNNLGIIYSLIHLQLTRTSDPSMGSLLKNLQNRIQSIALIHQKLYRNDNLSKINFCDYSRELLNMILSSYSDARKHVKVDLSVDKIDLDIETVMPCGLIINELISNSLKYAFPDERQGLIRFAFRCIGPTACVMEFTDNGIGLPKDFDWRKTSTMGMMIIHSLSEQLGAETEVDSENGVRWKFSFHRDGGSV